MNENLNPLESIQEIKTYMQKSTRFLSLSGWSGIWVGTCGIISGLIVLYLLNQTIIFPVDSNYEEGIKSGNLYSLKEALSCKLTLIAVITFVVAVSGGFFFSMRKAKKDGIPFVNHVFKRMFINFLIPLVSGGLICLAFIKYDLIIFIAPITLVFYGLALLLIARDTLDEVKKLALFELALGILSFFFLQLTMIFWIAGFGVLHIIYGIIMWNKYDKK